MVRHPRRLAILVGAKKADVEVVPGKLEVVGVAAEEGDLLLGRKHQPHVGVFAGPVEMVGAPLVERDDVAAQSAGRQRFLLDLGHHAASGSGRLVRRHVPLHRRLHAAGHVLDRHEDVEFEVVALELVGTRGRGEPVAHVIVPLVPEFGDGIGADMVVGEHEAVGGDERPRAAGAEPHRRLLEVGQPLRREFGPVVLFQGRERLVEEPHPLVGGGRGHGHASGHDDHEPHDRATQDDNKRPGNAWCVHGRNPTRSPSEKDRHNPPASPPKAHEKDRRLPRSTLLLTFLKA